MNNASDVSVMADSDDSECPESVTMEAITCWGSESVRREIRRH